MFSGFFLLVCLNTFYPSEVKINHFSLIKRKPQGDIAIKELLTLSGDG